MKKFLVGLLDNLIARLIYKQKQIEISKIKSLPNTQIDRYFYVGAGTFFNLHKNFKELRIERNVNARKSCNFLLYANSTLIIGENVFFNNYCSVNCLGRIEIGANTLLGEGVKIYDHNHLYNWDNNTLNVARDDFKIGYVKIGKNCWIGSNVTILNNVEIGDNVIIGANCLIYKSVEANSLVKSNTDVSVTRREV